MHTHTHIYRYILIVGYSIWFSEVKKGTWIDNENQQLDFWKRERKRWRQLCKALNHGWRNSRIFFSISFFPQSLCSVWLHFIPSLDLSRPKQVKDVAHQDEVVRVLTNTLETGSVNYLFLFCLPQSSLFCFVFFILALWKSCSNFFHLVLQCPHMLFYGPPGTGKTTTALAIAHQLFGLNTSLCLMSYCL